MKLNSLCAALIPLLFMGCNNDPFASVQSKSLALTSSAFVDNGFIPSTYTCDGDNISPPLTIIGVPDGTETFVLIVDDPDAPAKTWVHWTIWNIDPDVTDIPEGSVPLGSEQGTTSFGTTGYGGPCPPSDTHRYFFKLYALSTTIHLDPTAQKSQLIKAMEGNVIAKAELIGLYFRK